MCRAHSWVLLCVLRGTQTRREDQVMTGLEREEQESKTLQGRSRSKTMAESCTLSLTRHHGDWSKLPACTATLATAQACQLCPP